MTEPTNERNQPSQANTSGGAYIDGNVEAKEFVGRDKHVHGDMVHGDKQVTIIQRLDPSDARNQRNHKAMRQLVRTFWVDGVLKHSLHKEVLIRLNLEEKPHAVDNRPWDLILQQHGQPDYSIPSGTSIIDVFDQMNQLLLILGEPGSGKTTTLLELADALLKRAEADLTHPTPVVFNLSSWSEKRLPLSEWLIDELRTKYNIPKKIAQKWIAEDELLPLLDGLDEVRKENRDACLTVINQFRQEHFVKMAVCSRTSEYENLATQLRLQGAILVQPLTVAQIDKYLDAAGDELSAVKVTVQQDTELQDMATTPLLLSVMVMAYHGMPIDNILLTGTTHFRRQHLFDAYVKRMFNHREMRYYYPVWKTVHWLSWLAKNMNQRQQTIFLIERLQPDLLQTKQRYWIYRFCSGIIVGATVGIFWGWSNEVIVAASLALTFTIVVLFTGRYEIRIAEQLQFDRKLIIYAGVFGGLLGGLAAGLLAGLKNGLVAGFREGLLFGLWGGLFIGLFEGIKMTKMNQTAYPNQGVWNSLHNMIIAGLILGLPAGLVLRMDKNLSEQISFLIVCVLMYGLYGGGTACIQHLTLRTLLWQYNHTPFNYAQFLDYCHSLIFLRKVGGGYIFIHRMLMEHFASLTDEDIERIASEVEGMKLR